VSSKQRTDPVRGLEKRERENARTVVHALGRGKGELSSNGS
jgi:hypothetical protein